MKKALLFSLLAATTIAGVDAQGRKWDFRNWSAATVNNLKAGSDWSDIEKKDGTAPTELSKDNCFWEVTHQGTADGVTITANGVAIAELEGLLYTNTTDRSLAIAVNYQVADASSGFGPYEGASYLWFGGSKKDYFVIPNVAPGTEITMGIESHKLTDARGVELYIYSGNKKGTKLKDIDGNDVGTPTTYQEFTWYLPTEGITEEPNEDGTYNIMMYNTNGCHVYYITVGENSVNPDQINVAYLYDGAYSTYCGIDEDPIYNNVIQNYVSTAIDFSQLNGMSTADLNDSLTKYDVVVLSEAVSSGNDYAKAMVDIVNKVPMLNLKSFMYRNWGWGVGANPSPKANTVVVNEAYFEHELFNNITLESDGTLPIFEITGDDLPSGKENTNLVQAWTATAGSLVADDEIIATAGGDKAIHSHGTRNTYMLIPISSDNLLVDGEAVLTADAYVLVDNAIGLLAATKSKVTPAASPVVTTVAEDQVTTVSISCATAGSTIYYTVDGTDPTTASAVYTEPFSVTVDGIVVKAFATAQGYEPSAVTTSTIVVKSKLAAPVISVEGALVTITAAEGDIYFNVSGSTAIAASQKYEAPFEAPYSCEITAFTASDTKLASDAVTATVSVAGSIYNKELVHVTFDSSEGWPSASKSQRLIAAYNALSTEPTDSTLVTVKASDGVTDSTYYEYEYAPLDVEPYVLEAENIGWRLESHGQQLYYVTDYNNALCYEGGPTAYGYSSVFAAKFFTRYAIGFQNIKHVREDGVANAFLTSKVKYQAPFELALLMSHVVGSGANQTLYAVEPGQEASGNILVARFEVAVSVDGENWNVVDTLKTTCNKMVERKSLVYEGTDEVFVRVKSLRPENLVSSSNQKANISDIIICGEGEDNAIENIAADKVQQNENGVIFDLFGRRVSIVENGKLYIRDGKKFMVK